jgi:hypothetical protein
VSGPVLSARPAPAVTCGKGRCPCLKSAQVARYADMSSEDLPVAEFAFPGPLRDQLVAAIVTGGKTTTTGLVADYENENEALPRPGLRRSWSIPLGTRSR